MSNTYCPLPWVHTSLQNNDEVLPCCQFMNAKDFQNVENFNDAYYGNAMNSIREKMLKGDFVDGCQQCYEEEKIGRKSLRQESIDKFGHVTEIKIRTLEVVFDNLCNLKCRMCASPHAHLWYDEEKQLYGRTLLDKKYSECNLYKDIDYSQIEKIQIYGGEPMYSPHLIPFFKKLDEQDNLENMSLMFVTNATIQPKDLVYKTFLKVKSLKINLSIDALGQLNGFIRKNSNFDEIVQVMKTYYQLLKERGDKETEIGVHSAIGVYNLNTFKELQEYVKTNFPKFQHTFQMIQYPIWLNVRNMPKEYKDSVKDFITEQEILDFLNLEGTDHFSHFLNFHNKLNEIRNEELGTANPWLSKFIETYRDRYSSIDSSIFFRQYVNDLLD